MVGLVLLLAAAPPTPEEVTAATAEMTALPPACSAPTFAFRSAGVDAVSLVLTGTAGYKYRILIEEPHQVHYVDLPFWRALAHGSYDCKGIGKGETLACALHRVSVDEGRLVAAEQGERAIPVDLSMMDLLASGGRVNVRYIEEFPCRANVKGEGPPNLDVPDWNARDTIDRAQVAYNIVALEPHHLTVDVGSVFAMRGDGGFDTRPEVALSATSRWWARLTGAFDLRLSSLPIPNTTTTTATTTTTTNAGGSSTTTTTTSPIVLNNSTGTVIEAAGRFLWHPSAEPWQEPAWGLVVGAGVRAPSNGLLNLEPNLFGGVRLQVAGYNAATPTDTFANTHAFLEFGYLRDRYWKTDLLIKDQRDRGYLETQMDVPGLGGPNVRLAVRLRASKPFLYDGPSELRISALASIDPAIFKGLFGVK